MFGKPSDPASLRHGTVLDVQEFYRHGLAGSSVQPERWRFAVSAAANRNNQKGYHKGTSPAVPTAMEQQRSVQSQPAIAKRSNSTTIEGFPYNTKRDDSAGSHCIRSLCHVM
jgi:hypothetical protein